MTVSLTVLLIGSILSLNLLILVIMKCMISITNLIKDLRDNSEEENKTILQFHNSKTNGVECKSKVNGSNVIYFNSYCKVKLVGEMVIYTIFSMVENKYI
ncbi:MAG: hypothetical protein ACREVX_11560 [Clostridium sp.]|uniref:hypothetical protein n=1 Tax=Clostridium sp. TaxID=1506 RepID=UPI003D6D41DE